MNIDEALAALKKRFPALVFDMSPQTINGELLYHAQASSATPEGFMFGASIYRSASPMCAYTRLLRICLAATKE